MGLYLLISKQRGKASKEEKGAAMQALQHLMKYKILKLK
jgi:hypothetical protein